MSKKNKEKVLKEEINKKSSDNKGIIISLIILILVIVVVVFFLWVMWPQISAPDCSQWEYSEDSPCWEYRHGTK